MASSASSSSSVGAGRGSGAPFAVLNGSDGAPANGELMIATERNMSGRIERAPRRDRRAGIVPDDRRHRAVAERIDEPHGVAHHVEDAELIGIGVVGIVPAGGAPVAALIGRDHVIPGRRKRQHHLAPAVGELGKAVQQQHRGRPGVSKPASKMCTVRPLTLAMVRERMPGGSVPLP